MQAGFREAFSRSPGQGPARGIISALTGVPGVRGGGGLSLAVLGHLEILALALGPSQTLKVSRRNGFDSHPFPWDHRDCGCLSSSSCLSIPFRPGGEVLWTSTKAVVKIK